MLENKLIVLGLVVGLTFAGSVSAQTMMNATITKSVISELISHLVSAYSGSSIPGPLSTGPVIGLPTQNCRVGDFYNRQTGERCPVTPSVVVCQKGDVYSSQTGEKCPILFDVGPHYHTVDTNHDYRISLEEITAYAANHDANDPDLVWAKKAWASGGMYASY